jgi:hypothetical protein
MTLFAFREAKRPWMDFIATQSNNPRMVRSEPVDASTEIYIR